MKILIDTCIWSKVLRRNNPDKQYIERISDIIKDGRVAIIGSIRQEVLSGVADKAQFKRLKDILSTFEDTILYTSHYETAAEFSNICRISGIQGSAIDFLICASAHLENYAIFTDDNDFAHYARYLPIKLLK